VKDGPVDAPDVELSLMQDPMLRLQRALRIAPKEDFGTSRRVLLLILVTWVPIMVWAAATGRFSSGIWGDSILRHLGVHVRCLLAMPLFLMSAPLADRVVRLIVANFLPSGIVRPLDRSIFIGVIRSIERLRDSKVVWLAFAGIAVAVGLSGGLEDNDAVAWGQGAAPLEFGGAWALHVVRPLFVFMLLAWLWRLILTWILFRKIARLDLRLVPSHPDRVAGLGFIELHSVAFSLVVIAISSVVCVNVAHQILSHGAHLKQFQVQLGLMVVLVSALFILPLTSFVGPLWRVRIRGRFAYGALAGRHVSGVHARWVEHQPVEDEAILQAPEIGPAADMATLYDLARRMRTAPIGKIALGSVVLPALLPVLFVATIEIPFKEMVQKLVETLL
jgi:hypothetical protein